MMNKQTIFDTVVKHMAAQKTRAMSRDGYACAYRGANGTKCAVGCLISDNDYRPAMEGKSVTTLKVTGMLPDYLCKELGLLEYLQFIHDDNNLRSATIIKRRLNDLASIQKLDDSVVDLLTEWNP
jgi:hypothetical protein